VLHRNCDSFEKYAYFSLQLAPFIEKTTVKLAQTGLFLLKTPTSINLERHTFAVCHDALSVFILVHVT